MSADLAGLVSRLEAVTTRLESVASKSVSGAGDGDGEVPEFLSAYDDFVAQYVDPFVAASAKVESALVKEAAAALKKVTVEQKRFLVIVSKHSQPKQDELAKLFKPLTELIEEVRQIKDKNFKDRDFSNYTAAVNEGVGAFGWVGVSPAPAPYVKSTGEGAQFYTNRILKERQDKDWVKSYLPIFTALFDYVKKYHTTGVSWNKNASVFVPGPPKPALPNKPDRLRGVKFDHRPAPQNPDRQCQGPPATASAAAAPGAPPPPPPPPAASAAPPAPQQAQADVSALLQDLNKGAAVTSGLKRVTDDMKTHKNPKLRQSAAPYKKPVASKPTPVAKPKPAGPVRTPALALVGKKWIVEYHSGRQDLVIDEALMKHTVYVYKCDNCTLTVKGKVNSITLDNCKKTAVVFDNVVSGLEFVNCQSVQGQVTGKLPTASIEKTDGCQLYLSKESMNCQIISAKSSEMNISVPQDDGDFGEFAIVEQFRSVWNGKTFVTEPTELAE